MDPCTFIDLNFRTPRLWSHQLLLLAHPTNGLKNRHNPDPHDTVVLKRGARGNTAVRFRWRHAEFGGRLRWRHAEIGGPLQHGDMLKSVVRSSTVTC